MTIDDDLEPCQGKTKVDADIANILAITKENRKYARNIMDRLNNDLCCVTYPVKEIFFNWKRFWFKSRVVDKKLWVVYRENGHDETCITVKTELPFRWPQDEHEVFKIDVMTALTKE